ncbi:MAG TPA: aldehyde dehydrogenase family protein [Myxococcaceae bacterium]|nr:aldehyde dehydrogenase family protein [Myxococcaceae bacterium]
MPPSEPPLTDPVPLDGMQAPGPAGRLLARGRVAQESWSHTHLAARVACLVGAAHEMLARRQEAMDLATREIGKVHAEALFNEALGPLDAVKGWARVLRPALRRRRVPLNPLGFPGKRAWVEAVPRGVVAIIAPWNFPVAGLYRSVFPALLSGNAVVLKPSELSPRSSGWFAELLAGHLPAGVLQVLQGDGAMGAALLDARPDACVFTGSPATGRKVSVRCADLGIPCSAEMGGKDPAIVLADCDLERTVAGITHWALCNAGQACGAIEVVYAERAIADALVSRLGEVWSALRSGPLHGAASDVAPMASARQLEVVRQHVEDARARGATVVTGGAPLGEGLWFPPTLLDHCNHAMAVVRDETFGPVLAVVRVEGPAEAIRAANQLRYGLGASIWTRDLARGQRLAERLDYGVVSINNHSFTGAVPALPWSGTRATGFGVANSALALPTFVRPRAVVVDRRKQPELYWMPYDQGLLELGDVLADLQNNRLGRAWKLPGLMRRRMRALRDFFRRRHSAQLR